MKGTLIGLHIHLLTFTCGTSVLPRFPQNNLHLPSYLPPLLSTHTHTPPQLLHLTLESPMTWLTSHVGIKCTCWGALAPSSREREGLRRLQLRAMPPVTFCTAQVFSFIFVCQTQTWIEVSTRLHLRMRKVHTHSFARSFAQSFTRMLALWRFSLPCQTQTQTQNIGAKCYSNNN